MAATLDEQGQLHIPAAIRDRLGLQAVAPLTLPVAGDKLRIANRIGAIRRMQQRFAPLRNPLHAIVDEFLRKRRRTAEQE